MKPGGQTKRNDRIVLRALSGWIIFMPFVMFDILIQGLDYQTSNPFAVLIFLVISVVAPALAVVYPFIALGILFWFGLAIAKDLPRLLKQESTLTPDGAFAQIFVVFVSALLMYFGAQTVFAIYLWLYTSCEPTAAWNSLGLNYQCTLLPTYQRYLGLSLDQFIRPIPGIVMPIFSDFDPLADVSKTPMFHIIRGVYQLLAATSVVVLAASTWNAMKLIFQSLKALSFQ